MRTDLLRFLISLTDADADEISEGAVLDGRGALLDGRGRSERAMVETSISFGN